MTTYSRVSVPSFVLAVWLGLSSLQGAAAYQAKKGKTLVCNTDANGVQHCTEKLSPGVIAAIIVTTVGIILLAIGVWFFIRRSRSREESVEDNQFQIEASQMQGPPPIVGVTAAPSSRKRGKQANTTYAAKYDPSSAPVLPQLAYAAGSAPVLSMSNAGPPSAPLAARMGGGASGYGFGPGSAGPYGTPPQTAPNGKGFGQGKSPYPFVGISSSQLPQMPQPGPSYSSGGYVGNRI